MTREELQRAADGPDHRARRDRGARVLVEIAAVLADPPARRCGVAQGLAGESLHPVRLAGVDEIAQSGRLVVTHGADTENRAVGRDCEQQANGPRVAIGRDGLEHDCDRLAAEPGAVRGDGFRRAQQFRIAQRQGVGEQVVVMR